MKRGERCSLAGKLYENVVYSICKKCKMGEEGMLFNTQEEKEIGGCTSCNDIICNFKTLKDLPIEIKKLKTPDWMQCKLVYDNVTNRWSVSLKSKIPIIARDMFANLIFGIGNDPINLFNGKIPPFMNNNIKLTYSEWVNIKKSTTDFRDIYIDCPNTTIRNLYRAKGCYYIQVSEKGLYHLGEDICQFGVPEFLCEQEIRIRIKVHSKKNCKLSVMAACKPKNAKGIPPSQWSLDDVNKLPSILKYDQQIL